MKLKKWRGTLMFFVVLAVLGLTVGLRLYSTVGGATAVGLGATSQASGTSSQTTTAPSAPNTPKTPAPKSPSPATIPAPAPVPTASRTISGQAQDTPYGPIQVSVTFVGKTISSVTELQAPNDRELSIEINAQAAPILAQEVLTSQSARIDTVSGATYTSDGYALSVQSAIDQR